MTTHRPTLLPPDCLHVLVDQLVLTRYHLLSKNILFYSVLGRLSAFTMPKIPPQQTASQVTRLPLAKFSHTTTGIHHSGPFSWDHVNGCDDLVCLLDKFPGSASTPSRLVLRVASNHGILVSFPPIACQSNIQTDCTSNQEQIDLEHFVRMTANQSQSVSNTSSSKLPFVVVVKKPSLAVKYPQNQTYVRTSCRAHGKSHII